MTEVAGPTLADASGNGHTGTLPGGSSASIGASAGFLSGEVGVNFPDRFAEVDFAPGSAFPTFSTWTFDFWAKLQPSADLQEIDFLFFGPSIMEHFLIQADPTTIQSVSTISPSFTFGSAPLTLPHFHCWHYYAATFDGAGGNVRFYVDGVLFATLNNPFGAGATFTPTAGGGWINSTSGAASFDLMHTAFYPSQLSGADIAAIYAAATPRQDGACFSFAHGQAYIAQ